MHADAQAERARVVAGRIGAAYLAGEGSEVQGAVLADLLATWLAGHPNFVREDLLRLHLAAVRALMVVNERLLFDGGTHPQNRHGAKG